MTFTEAQSFSMFDVGDRGVWRAGEQEDGVHMGAESRTKPSHRRAWTSQYTKGNEVRSPLGSYSHHRAIVG